MKLKLKPQPKAPRRRPARAGRARAASRRPGRGARRPNVPFRQRMSGRIPSLRRVLAGLGAVACAAALVALLTGPWLRVTEPSTW